MYQRRLLAAAVSNSHYARCHGCNWSLHIPSSTCSLVEPFVYAPVRVHRPVGKTMARLLLHILTTLVLVSVFLILAAPSIQWLV